MNYKDITERLNPIFRETFDDDTININADMVASEIEQWDSLNNIRLMVRIEELFGIFFETSELAGLANVGELINVIKEKLD